MSDSGPNSVAPRALQGETPESLLERLTAREIPATIEEARRIVAHVVQRGNAELMGVRNVRAVVRDAVLPAVPVGQLKLLERRASAVDPFVKYLFELGDGARIETVRIPLETPGRFSVCVSSQVGCALGCTFCATGTLGFKRNLHPWEIVEQVRVISRELRASGLGRVHGVVFQGMGEPMLNLDNVLQALAVFSNPCGLAIDARQITICTAGIVPGIRRLAATGSRARLGISVTSARAALRRTLMPIEGKYPISEVIAAAKEHYESTGRLVMLAFALLGGVNTDAGEAEALAQLLKLMPARLSLIDFNPVDGLPYRPPTEEERTAFHDSLTRLGVPVVRRYSGGKDIGAACGQLAAGAEPRAPRRMRTGVADPAADAG
jgi:23S rRNA (adenine2503-C2)-methyltransferase